MGGGAERKGVCVRVCACAEVCACLRVIENACVCVCVCVREREGERERARQSMFVCVCVRLFVYECVRARARVWMHVCVRALMSSCACAGSWLRLLCLSMAWFNSVYETVDRDTGLTCSWIILTRRIWLRRYVLARWSLASSTSPCVNRQHCSCTPSLSLPRRHCHRAEWYYLHSCSNRQTSQLQGQEKRRRRECHAAPHPKHTPQTAHSYQAKECIGVHLTSKTSIAQRVVPAKMKLF